MSNVTVHSDEERDGVREVRLSVEVEGDKAPAVLFLPPGVERPPLVFIQHPGMSSKDDFFVRGLGMQWARAERWACAGVDAPMHGDRATGNPMALFADESGYPAVRAQFAREVSAVIDAAAAYSVDTGRVAYVGYSLGSMLGLHAVAGDERFTAAAFFAVGEGRLAGSAEEPESAATRLARPATLIVGKEQDELIPRASTEALYDAIGGAKELRWLPGGHFEMGPDIAETAAGWLQERL